MNFPALENKIYFDTARSGLMYDELLKWRKDHEHLFLFHGSQFRINHDELFDKTRFEINSFFNSPNSRTCLLYTSPSPRDRTRSRMPSSA